MAPTECRDVDDEFILVPEQLFKCSFANSAALLTEEHFSN